ncbi:MAG: nucleoside recognition domain-containing protein, partial [Candidatus Kapaibacteriota bacterium]
SIHNRFFLIKALENEDVVKDFVRINNKDIYLELKRNLSKQFGLSVFEILTSERNILSTKISQQVSTHNPQPTVPLIDKIDLLFLRPSTGYFFALIFFMLYFSLIFIFGGWLSEILEKPLEKLFVLIEPLKTTTQLGWFAADGIIQGIVGAIGIVLPYFLPLLFLTAILEESGYMARIAYLMDVVFHQIGLHGKSVASFIMGFGCTVPAVFATRIIENRRDRLLASILINFIPCSARLTVIFALTTALTGPIWTVVIFSYILLAIASTAKILSWFLPKPTGLIMEIPPLRIPSLQIVFKKTYFKLLDFFKIAFPFLLLGSIILAILEYLNFHSFVNSLLSPLIQNILGLPKELGTALVFGFLRKELAVFMIARSFETTNLHLLPMTVTQVVTFIIFVVFYLPCISTTAVFLREFGLKHLLLTITIGLIMSTLSALLFRFALTTFL